MKKLLAMMAVPLMVACGSSDSDDAPMLTRSGDSFDVAAFRQVFERNYWVIFGYSTPLPDGSYERVYNGKLQLPDTIHICANGSPDIIISDTCFADPVWLYIDNGFQLTEYIEEFGWQEVPYDIFQYPTIRDDYEEHPYNPWRQYVVPMPYTLSDEGLLCVHTPYGVQEYHVEGFTEDKVYLRGIFWNNFSIYHGLYMGNGINTLYRVEEDDVKQEGWNWTEWPSDNAPLLPDE